MAHDSLSKSEECFMPFERIKIIKNLTGNTFQLLLCLLLVACDREESKNQDSVLVVPGEPVMIAESPVSAPGEIERELLIGIVGPETGPQAKYGEAVYLGAQLAVQRLNESGGIGGQELRLVHYDNQGEARQTIEIVQHLVGQRAMAIITAPTGWATFGPTSVSNSSSTILISIGSRRRIASSGDYIFQLSLSDEIATDYLIEYSLREMGFRRFALVSVSDYDYSLDISASFKKALGKHGGELLIEVDTYDTYTGEHNVKRAVAKILSFAGSLDAVIFTGDIHEAADLTRGMRNENVNLPLLAGEDLFSNEFLEKAGHTAVGSLVYATYPNRNLPQTVNFITEFQDRNQETPDRFAALAFDATSLLTGAIIESGSRYSSVVREAMLRSKIVDGVTGTAEFNEQGSSIKVPLIYKVVAGQGIEQFALQN
jgi:branched-chain amino acid transport system substrate-binding protein